MKLARYFRDRDVDVRFVKGKDRELRRQEWDAIFVTTLFTWEWKRAVDTIKFYSRSLGEPKVYVGGILATLMPGALREATGAQVVEGLLDTDGKLGLPGDGTIETLVPDYSILDEISYEYPVGDAYFVHSTRGCVNRCDFCAVTTVEPKYESFRSIVDQVDSIEREFGARRDLVLMDNNTVASPKFDSIIDEIVHLGFASGARLNGRRRHVDFNQGLDARLMTEAKMARLAETAIWPLRMAFDDIATREPYETSVRWAASHGLKRLSNYILFNHEDTPEDFYERLRLNVELNAELETNIYSFPMRFSPLDRVDRKHIGPNWTWRYIRGVQCILNATRGVVGVKKDFFMRAFGSSPEQFVELISMPEEYIVHRTLHEATDARQWREQYRALSGSQNVEFRARALGAKCPGLGSGDPEVDALLARY
jgi:hypothetical protein